MYFGNGYCTRYLKLYCTCTAFSARLKQIESWSWTDPDTINSYRSNQRKSCQLTSLKEARAENATSRSATQTTAFHQANTPLLCNHEHAISRLLHHVSSPVYSRHCLFLPLPPIHQPLPVTVPEMRPFNSPGSCYYPGTTPSCNRTPAMPTTPTYTSIWAPTVGQRRVFSAPLPHHHPQDHITPAPHSHPSQSTHPLEYPHPPLPSLNAMSSPLSPAAPSFYPSSQPTAPSSPATSVPRLSPPSPITIPAVPLPFPKPQNVSGVVSFLDPSTKGDRSTPLLLTESVLEGYAKIYRALEEVRRELQHTREETKKEMVAKESAVRASAKQVSELKKRDSFFSFPPAHPTIWI